jgi:hypothetical protein
MLSSFLHDVAPKVRKIEDLIKLLGEPDGKGVEFKTPWELSVRCSWGAWNLDRVIYWPTHQYEGYQDKSFRIDDWLYIVDDL